MCLNIRLRPPFFIRLQGDNSSIISPGLLPNCLVSGSSENRHVNRRNCSDVMWQAASIRRANFSRHPVNTLQESLAAARSKQSPSSVFCNAKKSLSGELTVCLGLLLYPPARGCLHSGYVPGTDIRLFFDNLVGEPRFKSMKLGFETWLSA
jgi:hypothetical protein